MIRYYFKGSDIYNLAFLNDNLSFDLILLKNYK